MHQLVEGDLDVDFVIAAVDAGRVVDRVGVDEPSAERVLGAGQLGEAEIPTLPHHVTAQHRRVDAHRVVGPVADRLVGLGRRLHVRADAAVPEQVDRRTQDRRDQLVGTQRVDVVADPQRTSHLVGDHDRLQRSRIHASSGRDERRVVVGPARSREIEQAMAFGVRRATRRIGIEEEVPMVERGDEPQVVGQQHAVAEHVARHVADAHRGDRVVVDIEAEDATVPAHALPGAARRDPHLLVVVAVAATRGERIAEPEAVVGGDLVGDVAERRRALVGRHHEVRIGLVVDDAVGRVHDDAVDHVVGHVEQRPHESPVPVDAFRAHRVAIGRVSRRALHDEPALGPHGHDHRVLHHLRLHQPEDLRAEVVGPVAPPQAATGDRPTTQMDSFDLRRAHEDLESRARFGEERDVARSQLHRDLVAGLPAGTKGVRPSGGVDQGQQRPADPVLVERRYRVEAVEEDGPDGIRRGCSLHGIVAARRVESSVEQFDEQARDLRLSHQRAGRRTTS